MSGELILVVCAANICRSPLGELLLRRQLETLEGVHVESAGTRVREEAPVCTEVAVRGADTEWSRWARAHCARMVTEELLSGSALILAADSEARAEVVTLAPGVRDRAFTLREAAHLGVEYSPARSGRRYGVVSGYALHLDRSRSVVGPIPAGRSRLWRGNAGDPASIVDRHGGRRSAHLRALREVEQAAMTVAGSLGAGGWK